MSRSFVHRHQDLEVYRMAFEGAMALFETSKQFPHEEKYSLTDQVRRSFRSVCVNLAEAWRKRLYEAAFVAKLTDCAAEAAETQTWIDFAVRCQYRDAITGKRFNQNYDQILGMLTAMIRSPQKWLLPKP
ncbi:MAG: four helix bundle protein [Cyanobacteria bacterium P01_D01_bin.115]